MSIYHQLIRFKDKTNYDYELVVATFSPDSGENETYLNMEPVFTDSFDGSRRTDYGAKFKSVAKPKVTFVEVDGSHIYYNKVQRVLRWLTGSRDVSFMDVCNKDGDVMFSYMGRFTDVKLQKLDAKIIGIVATFTATTPWAYSGVKEINMSLSEKDTTFAIDNETDDLYSYIYPNVTYKNASNGAELVLTNTTIDNTTHFLNLQQDEVITMNDSFVAYSDNTYRVFSDDFNFKFPTLIPGTNEFKANGNGELVMKFRYPMKVGDGLLNEYDLTNGVWIYVETLLLRLSQDTQERPFNIVHIKGDTTRNPPNGVNVKVDNAKMIIRGKLQGAKLIFKNEIVDSTLVVNEGPDQCPFDDAFVSVNNGNLIINKDLDQIDFR